MFRLRSTVTIVLLSFLTYLFTYGYSLELKHLSQYTIEYRQNTKNSQTKLVTRSPAVAR